MKKIWYVVTMWAVWLLAFKLAQSAVTPYVVQQGALAQFDDTYSGFVVNQFSSNAVDTVFVCIAVVLLIITNITLKKEKKA